MIQPYLMTAALKIYRQELIPIDNLADHIDIPYIQVVEGETKKPLIQLAHQFNKLVEEGKIKGLYTRVEEKQSSNGKKVWMIWYRS